MVSQVEDFETLPWSAVPVLAEAEQPGEHQSDVDQMILTGLVSPV